LKKSTEKNKKEKLSEDWLYAAEKLEKSLGSPVKIKKRKKNNLLTIELDSFDKLEEIIEKLN
jgi:ParB family chromosome partitioning protein